MNRIILGLTILFSTSFLQAQATDDNEINIDQTGDTLTLLIDQIGYGNKMGLNNFSSSSAAMPITGTTLTFNIDQIGNENLLFGKATSMIRSSKDFVDINNIRDINLAKTLLENKK